MAQDLTYIVSIAKITDRQMYENCEKCRERKRRGDDGKERAAWGF